MELTKFGLMLDILGALLLATDLLREEYRSSIRRSMDEIQSFRMDHRVLWQSGHDEELEENVEFIRRVGGAALVIVGLMLAIAFSAMESVARPFVYYFVASASLGLGAVALQRLNETLSLRLLGFATYVSLPLVWLAFVGYWAATSVLSKLVGLGASAERWVEEENLPRFYGLFLLLMGFSFQIIGSGASGS